MAIIIPSPEIWHRDDFPILCNWRKLWTAVEVGVDRGEWSQVFLSRWQGHNFIGIDSYDSDHEMPWDRNADYQFAIIRYERYASRAKLVRGKSTDLARIFLPENKTQFFGGHPTQFVYIDGDHSYEAVRDDIEAWYPAVGAEGILAGHDFDEAHLGVIQAVTEFADRTGVTIYLTTNDSPPSWYCYKSGMPGADWIRNTEAPQ